MNDARGKLANMKVSKVSEIAFDTFDTAFAAQSQNFFGSETMPADEPDAWRPECEKWMRTACAFHHNCSGSLASLHRSFAGWGVAGIAVCPCTPETFAALLIRDGFEIRAGMVQILR
jgi:hypothetical protein